MKRSHCTTSVHDAFVFLLQLNCFTFYYQQVLSSEIPRDDKASRRDCSFLQQFEGHRPAPLSGPGRRFLSFQRRRPAIFQILMVGEAVEFEILQGKTWG